MRDIKNRYYIIDNPNNLLDEIYNVIMGDESKQRILPNNKMVVKLKSNDSKKHKELIGVKEYKHKDITKELKDKK